MRDSEKLYVTAAVLLTVGFLGGFAFVSSVVWAPEGSGANIGMGLLAPLCFLAGLAGIVVAVSASVTARRERRADRTPRG